MGPPDGRPWASCRSLVSCAVTYAKFGIPIGLPMADQVWATVNAHRRYFLAANGGKAFSFAFLPSTLVGLPAALRHPPQRPLPLHLPPTAPAACAGRRGDGPDLSDGQHPGDHAPAVPARACWGAVTAFRPEGTRAGAPDPDHPDGGAAGAAGVLLWGYISERYMADFMPFLIVAAGIGPHRHLAAAGEAPAPNQRRGPRRHHRRRRLLHRRQRGHRGISGRPVDLHPGRELRHRGEGAEPRLTRRQRAPRDQLPYWAPAGQLFAINNCSGLYLSTGNDMKDVPGQQIEHYTWMPVEQEPSFTQTIGFTFNRPERYLTHPVPLMKYGKSTLVLQPTTPGYARILVENSGTSIDWPPAAGWNIPIKLLDEQYQVVITTDPNLNSIRATWYGSNMLNHYLAGKGPAVIQTTHTLPGSPLPVVTVASVPMAAETNMGLCRSLVRGH